MRQTFLRRRNNVLPSIFGRHLWYLVILICHFGHFSWVSNFNKLTFARLFSLNLWSKFPWATAQFYWNLSLTTYNIAKSTEQVSFLDIFRATTPPHNFLAATILLFVKNLFEIKTFLEFNVCSWIASEFSSYLHCYMFWTCPAISHFTFHISLEVLYDNWLLLKLLAML